MTTTNAVPARERGILFNGAMVRALLAGTKTQTRRAVTVRHLALLDVAAQAGECHPLDVGSEHDNDQSYYRQFCPIGQVGDRLWVRETWQHANHPFGPYTTRTPVFYRADYLDDPHGPDGEKSPEGRYRFWRPSLHMPRSASRITLEITGVRVEQLGRISDADCWAEGAIAQARPDVFSVHSVLGIDGKAYLSPRGAFHDLWTSTGGTWDAALWTWVVDFRVLGPTTTSKETADV